MATQNVPLPQGRDIQRRVAENISDETGNLEDQSLDLDARAMAILGKRQQLSVRAIGFGRDLLQYPLTP